ncbi:MAG: glycosyltransferase family protein, partial [Desulfobaccales bacterium]
GVHGTGHGHAIRALTIARHFAGLGHEFLFVSHGTGADILRREFPVADCPNPETPIRGHKVDLAAAIYSSLAVRSRSRTYVNRLLQLMERFQPDVALSDYEYFVPLAARRAGVPCLSVDHQHVITACRHPVPWSQYFGYLSTAWAIKTFFSRARDFLVISFFQPQVTPGVRARIMPPLLRETVLERRPRDGGHVVAYQGYTTFQRFLPLLRAIPSPVAVYGFDRAGLDGNLHFKKNSEPGFLDDLSSCRYVVCGGSHTLISEALYYGKPVLSFPIQGAFEQFLNAFYLERLGYGRYYTGFNPHPEIIPAFEAKLADFDRNLGQQNFCGNPEIFSLVEQFIRTQKLTY